MGEGPIFVGDVVAQHSYGQAMQASGRLFAFCDTKWPDFLLGMARGQLIDDLISLSLHLRRVVEGSSKKMTTKIVNMDLGFKRDFSGFEVDLWAAVNRIVHHHRLEAVVLTQGDFYRADDRPVAGHLFADIEVFSDRGTRKINLAGFAVACVNELGVQSVTPRRIFH